MKLWVDDTRPAPEGWTLARTADEAMYYLRNHTLSGGDLVELSLDHDLGTVATGYAIALLIVEHGYWPKDIYFHTANPVGRWNMYQLLSHYAPEGVTVHR